jgi:hypothetical protein
MPREGMRQMSEHPFLEIYRLKAEGLRRQAELARRGRHGSPRRPLPRRGEKP